MMFIITVMLILYILTILNDTVRRHKMIRTCFISLSLGILQENCAVLLQHPWIQCLEGQPAQHQILENKILQRFVINPCVVVKMTSKHPTILGLLLVVVWHVFIVQYLIGSLSLLSSSIQVWELARRRKPRSTSLICRDTVFHSNTLALKTMKLLPL